MAPTDIPVAHALIQVVRLLLKAGAGAVTLAAAPGNPSRHESPPPPLQQEAWGTAILCAAAQSAARRCVVTPLVSILLQHEFGSCARYVCRASGYLMFVSYCPAQPAGARKQVMRALLNHIMCFVTACVCLLSQTVAAGNSVPAVDLSQPPFPAFSRPLNFRPAAFHLAGSLVLLCLCLCVGFIVLTSYPGHASPLAGAASGWWLVGVCRPGVRMWWQRF